MQRSAIERLLPAVYQAALPRQGAGDRGPGRVLAALVGVMEQMHEPDEAILATVEDVFDPYRTSEAFVGVLARWVALDPVLGTEGAAATGSGQVRNLVAIGADLARRRGTAAGLKRLLETATGVAGFEVEEPGDRRFHIAVRVPDGAQARLALVHRLVQAEKPAHVTAEVEVEAAEANEEEP